jgi:hypothetical protein
MVLRKNLSLIIGLAIPVLMILFVAGSIYLPQFFVHPKHNFLYALGSGYNGQYEFTVENGKLTKHTITYPDTYPKPQPAIEPTLYVHDVVKNESREISFAETRKLHLSGLAESPDGFRVTRGRGGGGFGFPFFYDGDNDYNAVYLVGHGLSKKMNITRPGDTNYYYYDFRFIGWILP